MALLSPHWPCLLVPACVQSRRQRQVLTRYQVKDLEQLFDQARQPPTITQPVSASEPSQQQKQQQEQAQQQQHQQQPQRQPVFSPSQAFESSGDDAHIFSSPQHVPNKRLRPSRMDFGVMFTQLQAWRQRFLSAHVPRHCFDAPELGAWVRYLRKQHSEGQLEQWKVDRWAVQLATAMGLSRTTSAALFPQDKSKLHPSTTTLPAHLPLCS